MMKSRLLILVSFAISTFFAYSQNVKFYSMNDMYGISMRETTSVCKDNNGFIWVSSKTGILRIAGDDHRVYQLPFQTVNVLWVKLVYKNSVLLAYSYNGQVFRYNPVYDRFDFLFDMDSQLNVQHRLTVYSLQMDIEGNLWIPTNIGFYKYRSGKFVKINNHFSNVTSICPFDDRHLLFICSDSICSLNIQNLECKTVYRNTGPFNLRVTTMFYDSTMNKLWLGTMSNGLFYYDFNAKTFVEFQAQIFPKQPVLAIRIASDSTLLIGTDGQGIREVDRKKDRIIRIYKDNPEDKNSIRGNGIYDILVDRENQKVWVCTYSGGLSYFEPMYPGIRQIVHKINNPQSLANDNVNQILEDSQGNIWFATDNGVSCWDVRSDQWKTFFHDDREQTQVFLSLCEDNSNRIWMGSYSAGVYVLNRNSGQMTHYSKNESNSAFNCNFVYDIMKDRQGNLWLGGVMDGIFRYISKENKFEAYFPIILIYSFTELSENEILATGPAGLFRIEKQSGNQQLLVGGYMVSDALAEDSTVWMCTQGNGLVQFNLENKTIREFTTESGLLSNYVNSILSAGGYLWLGTEDGLCRFNPADSSIINYSSLFPNVSFNWNAKCRLRNGQLALGTNNGAIIFDPASLEQTQPQGRIFIQDILVSGRSIRDDGVYDLKMPLDSLQEITLGYKQNNLTIEFLPLGTASDFKFSRIMEGFDTEQSHPSIDRKVTYTNMPAGKYVLKINMYDHSLSQLIAERRLIIRITPPFWETGGFRLLLLTIIGGILFFSLRFYINRLKQRHLEEKLHFFTKMAHEIRTTITLIKAPIEEISRKNFSETDNHYLDLATKQAGYLSSTVTHLLDLQKADVGKEQLSLTTIDVVDLIEQRRLMFESSAKIKRVDLLMTADPSAYSTAIDVSKMENVIDNLISNAIKYSYPERQVEILFTGNKKQWMLEVKDSGIGISRKAQRKLFKEFYRGENAINSNSVGSGIGLLLSKDYVKLHGGIIRCVSQENAGSSFKITIPFKREVVLNAPKVNNIPLPVETAEAMPAKNISLKKMRLLLVEDNEELLNFMNSALKEEFNVSTAKDGAGAWEIIRKQMPDIVVSDILMPNMDGFELCRLIKSTYETSHIPVILLTGLSGKAEQLHGLGLGADNYLTKPFDMALVTQRIRSIIQNRKAVRDKALKLIRESKDETFFINELNNAFIKKAIDIVQANMANSEFDKDEFASAMHVSASLLYKKIKSLTGQAPMDFVKAIRLNHALELLQTRKYTVTEAGELCGFSGINHFGKAFKKHFGKSPSEIFSN